MKKILSFLSVVLAIFSCVSPLTAQHDLETAMPLKRNLPPMSAAAERNLSPQAAVSLKQAREDVAKKQLPFQVGVTEAGQRPLSELCGTKPPKKINAAAIAKQEQQNEKALAKLQSELKGSNIQLPVKGAPKVGYPSCWWGSGWFSPVKDQGNCGSCWAFAATAAFEHAYKKFYGSTTDVSEQHIVDCGKTGYGVDAGSCGGGWSHYALDYMRYYGAPAESAKPYVAYDQTCTYAPKSHYIAYWGQVYPGRFPTRDEIKAYISYYGSVVTYMKAGINSFSWYKGGIIGGYPSNDPYDLDHAVIIVGWCDQYNSWIIKNSWGTSWGYSGYGYVDYDNCNIGKFVYYGMPHRSTGRLTTGGLTAEGGTSKKPSIPTTTPTNEEHPITDEQAPVLDEGN